MAFGIGTNTEEADRGRVRGTQEDIACGCWFTSRGSTIPQYIKYQDEEGVIHGISNIRVIYSERQNFCGIPMMTYSCTAEAEGQEYHFTLLFHLEECKWKLIWQRP